MASSDGKRSPLAAAGAEPGAGPSHTARACVRSGRPSRADRHAVPRPEGPRMERDGLAECGPGE
jgi:hypothetical protein